MSKALKVRRLDDGQPQRKLTRKGSNRTPDPGGDASNSFSYLGDVSCITAKNCWAVGNFGSLVSNNSNQVQRRLNLVLHWSGKKWQTTASGPNPGGTGAGADNEIKSLACTSGTNCWASGAFGRIGPDLSRTRGLEELLHWNGRSWSKAASVPNPDGTGGTSLNELDAVTCSGATSTTCPVCGAPARPTVSRSDRHSRQDRPPSR